MKLSSGELFWNKTMDANFKFTKLEESLSTDVLLIGAGMSGTLCAYVLASHGMSVTVIDKNRIGEGSSAANTGLLQYTSDKMLSEFVQTIGEQQAVLFYRMCLEAMDHLTALNHSLLDETGYRSKESIYYASNNEDAIKLREEYKLLKKHDFPVEFLDSDALRKDYKIDKPCAIRTWHDAEVNPYQFIQAITKKNVSLGVNYFENTEVNLDSIDSNKAVTIDGHTINFTNCILSTGYAKQYPIIADKSSLHRTYALATKPLKESAWKDEVMIWETKNPYLYFRTTPDHRIIAGGLDEEISTVEPNVATINEKASDILREIEVIFPHLNLTIENAWCSLFGVSTDGIPFIGAHPDKPTIYYLLGFEGNGTCYSMAGALILKDLLNNRENPYAAIVNVNR